MRSATKNRVGKDPKYLAFLHTLPCCVCESYGVEQWTPTEAAHSGEHGLSQKCPDNEALAICKHHHTDGPLAQHKLGTASIGFMD